MTTTFTRKLTIGERILHVDEQTSVNCVFAVRIRGRVEEGELLRALKKIQDKHPFLRMGIRADNDGLPHFVMLDTPPAIDFSKLPRHTDEDWKKVSTEEWNWSFDKANGPLARVIWVRGDEVSELVWVCPHSIVDGVSCTALMRELLQLLDAPSLQLDAYQPFVAITELLGESTALGLATRMKSALYVLLAKSFLWIKTRQRGAMDAGRSYFIHWKLDKEPSAAIVAACKAEKTTVYAACCTAVLDSFQQVLGKRAKGKVICPVDIRRFVPAIKGDHLFAFAPITEVKRPAVGDFWDRARSAKAELSTNIAKMDVPKLILQSEHFHGIAGYITKLLMQSAGNHDVTFSNMGRLDIPEKFDSFEVDALYSPSVGFPWRNPNTLVLSTYKGQMDFSFMSNESLLSESDALAIKEHAMKLLNSASHIQNER